MMRIVYDGCVLLCLAMLGFGIHLVLDEQRHVMSFSATTTAIVLTKHVEHHRYPNADPGSTDDFEPVVRYRYEVDGQCFRNTSIFPSPPLQHDAAFADATVARFRIGQATPVYYNPGDPGQACLIRRPSLPMYLGTLGSMFVLGVVACFSRSPRPGNAEDNRRKGRWLAALWHLVGLAGAAHYFHLAGADYTAGAPWLFGLYTYVGLIPVAVALPSSGFAFRVKNGIAISYAGAGVGVFVGVLGGVLAGLLPGHRPCASFLWVGYGAVTGAVLLAALGGWVDPPAPPRRNKTEEEEGDLARLLRPEDFAAVGVTGARAPSVNSRSPDSAYVVFTGASGATGGIEFDVFRSQNPESVFANAAGELPELAVAVPVREVGADDAVLATGLDNSRGGKWAGITVRKGNLVFGISIPDSPQVRAQLIALAKLVLARANKQAKPERDSSCRPRIKSKTDLMDFLQQEIGNEELALLVADVAERIGREGFVDVKPGGTGSPYAVEYDHRLEAEQVADKRTFKEVAAELEMIRTALKRAITDDERDRLERQRARLAGGMAILWINVKSPAEYERLRGRVKHSLRKLAGLTEQR